MEIENMLSKVPRRLLQKCKDVGEKVVEVYCSEFHVQKDQFWNHALKHLAPDYGIFHKQSGEGMLYYVIKEDKASYICAEDALKELRRRIYLDIFAAVLFSMPAFQNFDEQEELERLNPFKIKGQESVE